MKNLSRRMKRMLAILLVETIVAVNVISSYASDADGVMTFSEEEVSEMAANVDSTSEGGSSDSEPAAEESSYEEPAYEEPAGETPQEEEPAEETPQEEEPQAEEQQETPAEQEESGTDDPVAEEPSLTNEDAASEETVEETPEEQQSEEAAEEASECTCAKSCGTSEYDAECPVCCAVADLEEGEREAFLKDHCSKYEEAAEEKDNITEPEIINKESNIIITGTSVADGAAIEGASDFTIEVSGEVTLSDKAPAIEGYEFNGRIYLKDTDTEVSKIKKEAVENEKKENGVVTQIVKETKLSCFDVEAEGWVELTEDTTIVYGYTKTVQEEEEAADEAAVRFYAVCVDEDGNVIDGFEKEELTVSTSLDLTKAPIAIDGYDYTEASVDGTVVLSVEKNTVDEENTVYSYTTADGSVEVTEDVTVTLSYEMTEEEKAAVHFYAECVDEDGNLIGGYEKKTLRFEDTMDLAKAPFEIEGYEYVEASIGEAVVLSVAKTAETDENGDEAVVCTYTTAGGSVEVSEDTTLTLTYKAVKEVKEVALTWSYVDEEGLAIENVEGEPEFEDTLVLDDAEKAPVAIEGYEYVEASIDGVVITSIIKEEAVSEETAAATDEETAEPVYVYSYTTTTGENVAIEEDTEITLSYEETGIAVKVDATVVDEFGDEIDEKYTNMELPEFTDGVLVLDDVENPPVAKVQVRKSLFKVVKYTYVQATIDGKIVTGLKREATKETADLAEKEQEFIYSYSTDGASWTKLTEDTTVIFEYTDGKKTVFTYEDSKVQVTATLQHAGAVPDDAELVVTEITSGQAYDAYMEALNASDADKEYSEQNTLLYDIGFVATDEETGETVEVEPTEGSVKISIVFKQNQLSEDLSAAASEEVEIKHLPLADGVKESAGTTLDAENISASDVKVESVSNQVVNVDSGVAEFVTDSFSVYSVSSKPAIDVEKIDMDIMGILSAHGALGYGIVANSYSQSDSDTETNLMVGSYSGSAYMGASSTYSNAGGNNYFGSVVSGVKTIPFHLPPANIYLGTKATEQYEKGDFGFNDSEIRGTVIHKNHEINVANIVAGVGEAVNNAVSENNASNLGNAGNGEYLLDLRSCSAGTYVVNYSGTATINEQLFDIYLNSNQRLVINCTAESVCLQRYHLNGQQPSYYIHNGAIDKDWVTQAVVFNCPNATSVDIKESMGIIIAPKANVKSCEGANAGILICNTITGYNEWHYHNHDLPAPGDAELSLEITKMYNQPLTAEQFSFTLKDDEGNVVGTAKNDANGKVKFEKISYSAAGTYYYTITEDIPEGAVSNTDGTKTYDNVIYENSVITAAVTVELNTALNKYTVTSISYTKADGNGQSVTEGTSMIRNEEIETIEISGTKTWNDNNNQDGMRPASITINLLADGTKVKEQTVMADGNGNWSYRFTDLPKSANGQDIAYTITEEAVEGYTSTVDGYNVTNSHNPGTVDIFGEKVWDDSNDQDGSRPDSVTIKLLVNDKETDKTTVATIDNNWKWSFDNLPEYANGQKIAYTVTEEAVDGYEFVGITEDKEKGFVITNKHTPETVDIFGEKVWNDNDNQDGARPDSITIKLWADGKDTGKTTTTTAGQEWKWSFTDLAKYKNVNGKGVEIQYTVTEDAVEGYTTSSITKDAEKGFVITNTHTPETVNISGTKTWVDNDDQDGVRPNKIKVTLYADGKEVKSETVREKDNWSYSFSDLPKYKNVDGKGVEIQYTITEDAVEGYTTTYDGYDITNTHTPGKTSRTVTKVWNDQNNQDGARPTEITVQLYAGENAYSDPVVLNAANNWSHTWDNLPEKAQKKPITYTVKELGAVATDGSIVEITGYTTACSDDTFTITNTHEPAKVYVEGKKIWEDHNNQDGVRPSSITIELYADGVLKDSKEVTEKDGWTWKFDQLPKYAAGKEISYSVKEVLSEADAKNYTAENISKTFDIKNTHTPVQTEISGTKTWNDANNQDGVRPFSITVKLLANGADTAKTATASAATGWKYTFTDLDKFADGKEIKYTVEEVEVDGYEVSYSTDGLDVTNTHIPEKTSVTIEKKWQDSYNQDGIRPFSITVRLHANGAEVASATVVPDVATGEWKYTFTDLDKFADGKAIEYTVTEDPVKGYDKPIYDGFTITNCHTPETTEIKGSKVWSDGDNQDGKRPDSVTVRLLADGSDTGKSVEVSEKTNWTFSFTDLPKYKDGTEINYTVAEDAVSNYTTTISDDVKTAITITNSYTPGKTSVSGSKTWEDGNDQDGKRPEKITINLLADDAKVDSKTVTADDNWSWSFTDLPEYQNGQKITYTISEETVTGYTPSIDGYNVTNTHIPEKISVSGNKTWEDGNNQDGKRPVSITITLLANKEPVATKEVTAADNWSWEFTGLDKYKNGKEIGYSVVETLSEEAAAAYTVEYQDGTFNVINKHTPEKVNISGTKVWNDADDQDGVRPSSVTITLLADGKEKDSKTVSSADNWKWTFENLDKYADGKLINYTITEKKVDNYSTVIETAGDYAYTVTNSYTPGKTSMTVVKSWNDGKDQDGIRPSEIKVVLLADGKAANVADAEVTLNASNGWTYTWNGLDLKSKGSTIRYTVQEISEIEGYETSYTNRDGVITITNIHTPDEVYVEGTKTWNDANNQDGVRPAEIKINLLADGVLKESKIVSAEDNWSWKFDKLPKNKVDENGKSVMIQYSITEDAVTGYETTYPDKTFNVENTHTPEKTSISGFKKWEDNNNQDGVRPDSITVTLCADGVATDKTAIVTAADNWKFSFTDLPKYAEGKQGQVINYTVKEADVDGYMANITGNATEGYTITNTHNPEKINVSGEKIWSDNNNQDGLRPDSIKVYLYADGKELTDKTATVTASTDGKWNFTFENLDKFINGKEVTYTVKEEVVSGYTVSITGNTAEGYTITNTHTPETIAISGSKTWNDENNKYLSRPESITVNLLADGEVKESKVINEADGWKYSFTNLPKYKYENGQGGVLITYTISEEKVEGYSTAYNGYDITNSYTPEKTSKTVTKIWKDGENQDGLRQDSITVVLLANSETAKAVGVADAEVTLNASNNWTYTWNDLPVEYNKKDVVYTVQEISKIAGYDTTYTNSGDTVTITNTHTPALTEISGAKTWVDEKNQDGLRPEKITIRLWADGQLKESKDVTANDNWAWSFKDLPKNKEGKEIVYTITEDTVDGYTTEVDGYNVTNTHTPVLIEIGGTKTWNDEDNKYLGRPESITVYLLADGKVIDTKEVTDALGWTYSFTDLPKYAVGQQGHEIVYTIQEEAVTDYSTKYDGFDIANDYTPGETAKTVTKIWDDEDDQDGLRPTEIKVVLLANGETADAVGVMSAEVTLSATNEWTYTWTDLPVKYNKKDVTYTVKELGAVAADGSIVEITGYTTAYSEDTFTITNTHEPAEVYVEGVKTWEDGDNQDGIRPTEITIKLLADGEVADRMVVTPDAEGKWSWKFDHLPKFANGDEIQYSIEEIKVEGYESKPDYTDGKFNLINTHKPETVELSGSKTWNDANDQDGVRPSSITIHLLADGVEIDSKTVTAADNWSWTFEDLPKNKNVDGVVSPIEYTITEDAVDGYTAAYTDDGMSVVNSYTPEKTGRNVVKIWDDGNNADRIRPAYIEVQLYADGEAYGDAVVLNDANGWSYAWTDLQAKKGGQYIVYTVQEITNVSGYTTTVTESGTTFTIVNYHPVTPPPTPTPPTTPPSTPPDVTPTPTTPSITPPPEVPTPTPDDNEVLGARRGGAVLGARRGLDQAVLGKRRRPTTGDSAALIAWMITLFGAMGAATVSVIGLRKKEEEK